jgi:pyruvate dehydrogenase E1 component alpha subunit
MINYKKIELNLYNNMVYIRMVEDFIAENYAIKGKTQLMRCPVHLSTGQEAVSVGVISNLKKKDLIFCTHRSHGHYLAKGGSLKKMFAEIYGKETGCIGGVGGSMHLQDLDNGVFVSIPIVGSVIPLSVGSSLSNKLLKKSIKNVVFFGDGALEEGAWHESAEFAKLNNLKIAFVCENNLYSVYTPLRERQFNNKLERFAKTHSIKVFECDGNKVEDVYKISKKAFDFSEKNSEPVFILAHTYRHREHCGPNFDDHLKYRSKKEISYWFKRDPVTNFESLLIKKKLIDEKYILKLKNNVKKKIKESNNFALNSKLPRKHSARDFVYAK